MANEQNLRPKTTLSKEEAKKMGSKGGKASAKAKKQRKAMADTINLLLSQPCNLKDSKGTAFTDYAEMFGLEKEDIDNQMAVIISMFKVALTGEKSSVNAATFLRDTVGEKPKEQVKVEKVDTDWFLDDDDGKKT